MQPECLARKLKNLKYLTTSCLQERGKQAVKVLLALFSVDE